MFGRLSKRREVNVRRKFFNQEMERVLPPLTVKDAETGLEKGIAARGAAVFKTLETGSAHIRDRFLRRRFAEVLAKTPTLNKTKERNYTVSISPKVASKFKSLPESDLAWVTKKDK